MRVRAALGICGVVAASAAASAVALGQKGEHPAAATATWGAATAHDAGIASGAGDAGATGSRHPHSLSTWGTAFVPAPAPTAASEEEDDDADEDAGAAPAVDSGAPDAAAEDGGWEPSNVGLSVGLHGPGYGIPFGTANGSSLSDYVVSGIVPIGIDAGWFFNPHFYLGAYFTYGFGLNAGFQNDACDGPDDCQATVIQLGLAAHWHFRPESALDPWLGVGLGYEEIVFVGTSTDDGSTDISHGLPAINASLQGGLDFKPLRYLGFGPYAELTGGAFFLNDTGLHGWLSFGMRLRTNL